MKNTTKFLCNPSNDGKLGVLEGIIGGRLGCVILCLKYPNLGHIAESLL